MPFPVRRILFPTYYSRCAEGAYRHALYLADRFSAELHVLHVAETSETTERATVPFEITLADVCADLGLPLPQPEVDYDLLELVEVVETEVAEGRPADAILDMVRDEGIDLVVMGTHGRRGWRRGVIGSVAEAVARRAPCPVLTVRPLDAEVADRAWPPTRVLLAVELDAYDDPDAPLSPAALWATHLASAYRAELTLLYVDPSDTLTPDIARERVEEHAALDELAIKIREASAVPLNARGMIREGDPAGAIDAAVADTGTHLVVVGTAGRQGLRRAVFGSVAETVARTATCPVLVVPDGLGRGATRSQQAAHSEATS